MSKFDHILEKTKNLVVLYVEDDLVVREATKLLLDNFFKEIIVADDGEAGLLTYTTYKSKIDLIISDIEMPKMNGLEMIEAIRKIDNNIPIIIATAFTDDKYFLKAEELNVDKYFPKPINLDSVIDVLTKISQNIDK